MTEIPYAPTDKNDVTKHTIENPIVVGKISIGSFNGQWYFLTKLTGHFKVPAVFGYEDTNISDDAISTYSGGFVDGVPHGVGILGLPGYTRTGEFKEGHFVSGAWDWRGVIYKSVGAGFFTKGGHLTGLGSKLWRSGTLLEGTFKEDRLEGKGTMTMPDGVRYQGTFKEDMLDGPAIKHLLNGDQVEGEFVRGTFVVKPTPKPVFSAAEAETIAGLRAQITVIKSIMSEL